jgi:hypothetical protein
MAIPKHQLGILFVHGIGTQPAGDTITRWGDSLVKAIAQATNGSVVPTVERAGKDLEGGDGERTEARLRLEHAAKAEHWLLSEGWWAESFLAPTYFEFFSWGVRALPWALTTHIAQRYWLAKSGRTPKWYAVTLALLKLFLGLLFAPVVLLLLLLALVAGLLPIPALRGMLLSAQRLFTTTVGDSLVFVESPIRAGLIKTRILAGLDALQQRCERTVVVAHSQGAAVAVEALGGIAGLNEPPAKQPDTLITFGAGTNPLSVLRRSETLPKTLGFDPVRRAMVASVFISLISGWLTIQVLRGALAPGKLLLTGLLWLILGIASVAVGVGGVRLSKRLESRAPRLAKRGRRAAVPLSVVFGIPGLLALYRTATPFAPVLAIVIALAILGQSIFTILSRGWKRILTTVRCPPGLGRWIDIYASLDPVPCGPTLTTDHKRIEDKEIWNEGSLFKDHVRYWNNVDEFVLRVVRACGQAAASTWLAKLPREWEAIDQRARWRVSWLHMVRIAFSAIAVGLGVALYHSTSPIIRTLDDFVPGFIADRLARPDLERATLLVLIVLGVVLAYFLARTVWRWWVAKEQDAVLHHQSPQGIETVPLIAMGAVVWATLLSAIMMLLVKMNQPVASIAPAGLLKEVGAGVLIVSATFGLAAVSAYVLKKLNPPRLTKP